MNIYYILNFQLHIPSVLAKDMQMQGDQKVQMNLDRQYMSLNWLISKSPKNLISNHLMSY